MKDEQLIKSLIRQGESEQLEFKELALKEEIAKTICAFLNATGGTILIGVQDDGKVVGIDDVHEQEIKIKDYLFNSIIPEAPITVSSEKIGGKIILFAKVWSGSKPPYVFDGTIYFRKKTHTLKATPNDISKLIIERQKTELHWERQPALGIDIDELDELEIRKTLNDLTKYGRGRVFSENEVEKFLTHYGLFQNGILTNAAVVLFAKEPARYLPQTRIRLTVYKESKISEKFVYDKFFESNLFRNIDEILQFFEVNIAAQSKFSDNKWHREDSTFPKLALREGLVNALIHRDFSSVSGTVTVAFYSDRLEITNSGELYGGYTPFALTKNHLSVPRNPDIAHICFLRQVIEKIGRGTIKMIEDCVSRGFAEPNWQNNSGATVLTFKGVTVTSRTDNEVSDAIKDAVSDAVSDAVKRGLIDAVSDAVSDVLSDTVSAVMAKEKGVSIIEIMKKTGKSNATVKRYLQILKKINFVEFNGAAKTGKYFITSMALSRFKKNENTF